MPLAAKLQQHVGEIRPVDVPAFSPVCGQVLNARADDVEGLGARPLGGNSSGAVTQHDDRLRPGLGPDTKAPHVAATSA